MAAVVLPLSKIKMEGGSSSGIGQRMSERSPNPNLGNGMAHADVDREQGRHVTLANAPRYADDMQMISPSPFLLG